MSALTPASSDFQLRGLRDRRERKGGKKKRKEGRIKPTRHDNFSIERRGIDAQVRVREGAVPRGGGGAYLRFAAPAHLHYTYSTVGVHQPSRSKRTGSIKRCEVALTFDRCTSEGGPNTI